MRDIVLTAPPTLLFFKRQENLLKIRLFFFLSSSFENPSGALNRRRLLRSHECWHPTVRGQSESHTDRWGSRKWERRGAAAPANQSGNSFKSADECAAQPLAGQRNMPSFLIRTQLFARFFEKKPRRGNKRQKGKEKKTFQLLVNTPGGPFMDSDVPSSAPVPSEGRQRDNTQMKVAVLCRPYFTQQHSD